MITKHSTGQIRQTLLRLINDGTCRFLSYFLYHPVNFRSVRYRTIANHLTGQTSQTLLHLINDDTYRTALYTWPGQIVLGYPGERPNSGTPGRFCPTLSRLILDFLLIYQTDIYWKYFIYFKALSTLNLIAPKT